MKEEIFDLITEGLGNKDIKTQKLAQRFAQSIQRTREILTDEEARHVKDHGKSYLRQLALMTNYLLTNKQTPLPQRFAMIAPKLHEMELHQYHQLWRLHRTIKKGKKSKPTKKAKPVKKKGKKSKR